MAESQNLLKQVGERPRERVLTRFLVQPGNSFPGKSGKMRIAAF